MEYPPIELLRRGDDEAWDTVFQWLWPKALSIVRHKLRNIAPYDAEDVVIEAFTSLYDYIPRVHSSESLPSLLVAIANNRANNLIRHLKTEKRNTENTISLDELGADSIADGKPNPMESMETAELYELLEQIRMDLPRSSALFIRGYYLDGFSQREIAEQHGVPVSSVGPAIFRGLRIMHDKLKNNIFFSENFALRLRTNK